MTPKEKANQLVDKFSQETMLFHPDKRVWEKNIIGACVCALFAVDEILFILNECEDTYSNNILQFYQEVRKQIINFNTK